MPYYVTKKGEASGCSGYAVVKADGEVLGCHTTKSSAVDQMVAVSLSEGIEPGGSYTSQQRDTAVELETRAAVGTVKIGDYVAFTYRKQDKYGEVQEYVEAGSISVPGSAVQLNGSVHNPVVLIQVYEQTGNGWQETQEFVAKHISDIQVIERLTPVSEEQEPDAQDSYTEEMSEDRAVNLKPPAYMRAAARQGLRYYEQGKGGDGLVERTIREARAMAQGNVTAEKWVRIRAWIARHLVDLDSPAARPDSADYPSAGVVAHLLWGSGPSKRGAQRALSYAEGVVARIEAENRGRAKGEALSKIETRTTPIEFEVREGADGMTFEGYAAVFNTDSAPLPFIERIAPGAFTRSLEARNDIKLLWNHDTGSVLGSTRAGTLKLWQDDRGLRVQGSLPNTTAGRDAAELIKRGDVDSMSFGFSVPQGGDEWSKDGGQRTLKSVRLHEVSIVAFPAYSSTAGTTSVRGLESVALRADVDADALADAMIKVEEGVSLTEDEGRLLKQVVDSLLPETNDVAPEESKDDLAMLELKKKKLSLLTGK
jgi:hypothetical protein